MKKHSFYTMRIVSKGRTKAVLVDGFYDEGTNLCYYKNGDTWYSICPLTGQSVGSGRTRKECELQTNERLEAYTEMKVRADFNNKVLQSNEAVKIALMTR